MTRPHRADRAPLATAGKMTLNALLLLTLAGMVISSLPASELQRRLYPLVEPYMAATGLAQTWGMFAPDAPLHATELVAHIHYADGTSGTWRPPSGGGPLEGTRSYRWRKWSFVARNRNQPEAWTTTARWVVANHDHQGRQPVRVELVRRWRPLAAPGSAAANGWRQQTYFTLELAPGQRS